jgi:hypothetical protein
MGKIECKNNHNGVKINGITAADETAKKDDGVLSTRCEIERVVCEKPVHLIQELIFCLILFALGAYAVISGFLMPVPQLQGDNWYDTPGSMPIFLGTVMMICCVVWFAQVIKKGSGLKNIFAGAKIQKEKKNNGNNKDCTSREEMKRLGIAVALLFIYVFGMLSRMNYYLATFLFLAASMLIFELKKLTLKRVIILILISAVLAIGIGFIFSNFAKIPLP